MNRKEENKRPAEKPKYGMIRITAAAVCVVMCMCSLFLPQEARADTDSRVLYRCTVSERDMLKAAACQSTARLKKMGFSSLQIKKIRRAGTGAVPKAGYSNVTYTVSYSKNSFKYRKGKTYLETVTTWSWSRLPHFMAWDAAAVTTSEHFALTGGNATVYYYKNGKRGGARKSIAGRVYTKSSGRGAYCKFNMVRLLKHNKKYYYYNALGGKMTVRWRVSGNIRSVGISSNYGHSTVTCTPNVSFGAGGGSISFSPVMSVKKGIEAYCDIKR